MSTPLSLAGWIDDGAFTLDGFATAVDYILESVPELQHPLSVRTYAKMRHEPQLTAILRVYQLALQRATWSVDGTGCRDEVTQQIADDFGLPIKTATDETQTGARRRAFTWANHLATVTRLSLAFGHAAFAQQWEPAGGRYRLLQVQERMPQTIEALKLNPDGTLAAAVQNVVQTGADTPTIRTANHQLVWYDRERDGTNYFGTSLLRPSYALWLIKTQVLRVWATSNRRNGMGVWQVEAPSGATPQQVAEAQRIASTTKAGEAAGLGLPNGFTARLVGLSGTLPDHKELTDYLDRLMTRSTLTSILDMATAERGNRSLGETVMDLMVYAQQAEAQRIADTATAQIVVPLVDANWGEDEPAPRISVEDVGADVQLTSQDINWLLQWGGLHPDKPARDWIRHRSGIPAEDPNDPVNQAPTPNNNEPQAGH
jgi:hypothetical protein